jgi:hypothetical protein
MVAAARESGSRLPEMVVHRHFEMLASWEKRNLNGVIQAYPYGKANLELESFLHDWPRAELCRIEVG